MSNTLDKFIGYPNTSVIPSKIFRCVSYFQLSSRCLEIPMKHCLLCLVYYFMSLSAFFFRESKITRIFMHQKELKNPLWARVFSVVL